MTDSAWKLQTDDEYEKEKFDLLNDLSLLKF